MITIKIAYLFEFVHFMTGYAISRARSFHYPARTETVG